MTYIGKGVSEDLLSSIDVPISRQFVPVATEVPEQLKIVCFNIQRGHRILNILGALTLHPALKNAHILCLQEVDRFNERTGGIDLSALIARELGMNLVYGIEFFELNRRRRSGGGDHGNAILTRLPLESTRIIALPVAFDWTKSRAQPRVGRRMAIAADLMWGTRRVRIINAHLENQSLRRWRLAQMAALLAAEKDQIERGPAVLVGDMNTFLFREPKTLVSMAAECGFVDVMPPRPRGTWGRIFRLDYILAKGLVAKGSGVSHDVRSSDHKPLWASFELPQEHG